MGKSSRSSRDYSPRRDRDRDRDRNRDHRRQDKYESKKDNSSEILRMKEKMRSGLESARTYSSQLEQDSRPTKSRENYELSASEQLARTAEIEQIEEGSFQPSSFSSSSGGSRSFSNRSNSKAKTADNSHDTAIFGPTWKSNEQRNKLESKNIKQEVDLSEVPLPANVPMVPDHMRSENHSTRAAIWADYREQLISELSRTL